MKLTHRFTRTLATGLGIALLALSGTAAVAGLSYSLKARQLAPDTWVIEGANADFAPANGCNIINTGFIATGAGALVINTGPSKLYGEEQRRLVEATTGEKVVKVLNLNLHPDYFFGNQAYAGLPTEALPGARAGMAREGGAYADNMYRICGDWMKDTESTPPNTDLTPGTLTLGRHQFTLLRLHGHTPDDLVLLDAATGVAFVGGLAFSQRIPTVPHAVIPDWLASIVQLRQTLGALPLRTLVPSHGPVRQDMTPLDQTRDYLLWLDQHLREAAREGLDLSDVLRQPLPAPFNSFAAVATEYPRNLITLYPRYEREALSAGH